MEATVWTQIQVAVYSTLAGYGILWHVLLLIPLIKYYKTHFYKPFYIICISLAFTDLCNLAQNIINVITDPLLFHYPSASFVRWKGFWGRFFWYATTFHQLLIAMERSFVVLCPKGSKLIFTRAKVCIGLGFVWIFAILCNFCVLTDYCPYVWYANTTTIFYDYRDNGAELHNKVVDLGFQFVVLGFTVSLYASAGVKVRWARKKVHVGKSVTTANQGSLKRNRLENLLLLQGVFVSIPHTVVIVLYHTIFYIPNLSYTASEALKFVCIILAILGFGLNPILHLLMNKDLRTKTQETLFSKSRFDDMAETTAASSARFRTNPNMSGIFKAGNSHASSDM